MSSRPAAVVLCADPSGWIDAQGGGHGRAAAGVRSRRSAACDSLLQRTSILGEARRGEEIRIDFGLAVLDSQIDGWRWSQSWRSLWNRYAIAQGGPPSTL